MFLVAGLGNPGEEYALTPHNMGFLTVDRLAEREGIRVNRKDSRALVGLGEIDGQPVMLAKPQTFMNLSGRAVRQIVESKSAGALIVIERDQGLRTFIESGVPLDAQVSRDLLCAIFQRGGTLHDGAVIVQGDRIAAAACFLPLTTKPMRNLGTRHRAAIGITEDSDALAVVVSEQTWRISIAAHGELETSVELDSLLERLTRHTSPRAAKTEPTPEPEHAES